MNAARHDVDLPGLAAKFLAAQLAGDRGEALRVVLDEGVHRGARVLDLQAHVIRAAQLEIGRLWQANRISVAQEHLATGISQVVLARLLEHATPAARNGRVVAVACVEGELHDLPARLVADYLEQGGFTVRFHGASVPTDDLVTMVRRERPALVALSATMSFHVGALRAAIARLRADGGASPVPILVGGHAVEWAPEVPRTLGVETAPSAPEELVAVARRLTGVA